MLKKQTVAIKTRRCPSESRQLDEPPKKGLSYMANNERRGLTPEGLIEDLGKSVKDFWHLILRIV